MNDPVAVALCVAQILEERGLRYLVGGSLASSMSGEPRSTLDVDIVVAMTDSDVVTLVDGLRADFDVDEHAVARAVRERSSLNVFHRASAIKVDAASASCSGVPSSRNSSSNSFPASKRNC